MIIVIEGGDQAGKLTQSLMLQRALRRQKIGTKLFHFPDYDTPVGREIKRYLDGKRRFPPQVIHCLLAANRWEKLDEMVRAQERYPVLIMNRYYQSNLVYGMANGLKAGWLEGLDAGLPKADLVVLLDVSQKESFKRQQKNRDRFERDEDFIKRISGIYRRMARKKRWRIVDAARPKEEVHDDILRIVSKKMGP